MTGQRATVVRDLDSNCPDCTLELTYITLPGALSVHCPSCDYRRALTWRDGYMTTTEEHAVPEPDPDELASITGVITLADGSTSEFTINTATGAPGWVQYSPDATIERFEQTAALVDDLLAAARPHFADIPGDETPPEVHSPAWYEQERNTDDRS